MRKNYILTLLLAVSFTAFSQLDRSKKPTPAPAKEIKIGEYQKFELKNGLKVVVVENHKIPRVSFSLIIDRDPLLEYDKVGYLSMVGQLMRSGTTTRTKSQLDEEVDFIGASLSASSSSLFGSSLTKHQDKLLDLMTDVLYNPTFPEEELEKIKKQTISGLKSNQDDPNAISSNVRSKLLYGSDHPYGEIQLEEHVDNISIQDLKDYYNTYFKPNISYLAIVGDITLKEAKKIAKSRFGDWEAGEVPAASYTQPSAPDKNIVALVNRSNSVQTVLNVNYPINLKPGSPEFIKARVMNQVLGGTSASRLFKNIRGDKGFTYGANSSISSDRLIGNFNAGASVRTDVTDSSVVEFLYEMTRIRDEDVSDEELQQAKNVIIGSFGRSLERPQTLASFAINQQRYNLDENYYNNYVKNIQAVTKQDVKDIANMYVKPENAYIVAVGKTTDFAGKMGRFGEVKQYDMYGNEVDPSLAKLPDGLTADAVLDKYLEAVGGEEAVAKFENVTINMSASIQGQEMGLNMTMAKGRKSKMSLAMGPMVMMAATSNGDAASTMQMGNNIPMKEEQKEELGFANGMFTEFELKESGATVELAGVEQINGNDAYGLEVTLSKGSSYTLYFDAESGLKVRYSKVIETPQGSFNQTVDYSDYKEVDGVMVYHTLLQKVGPQSIEATATEVTVNQKLSPDIFKVE